MNHLIEELLFLAREDTGRPIINKEKFNLRIIDEVLYETSMIDKEHLITSEKRRIFINADRKLIKEAIRIFMDNSIKYTPPGGKITLNCYVKGTKGVISIEDTGLGYQSRPAPYIHPFLPG